MLVGFNLKILFQSSNTYHIFCFIIVYEDDVANQIDEKMYYGTSFRTFDGRDYSSIATIDVKKNISALAIDPRDCFIAIIENQYNRDNSIYAQDKFARLYQVGRCREEDDEDRDDDDDDEEDGDEEETDDSYSDDDDDDDDVYINNFTSDSEMSLISEFTDSFDSNSSDDSTNDEDENNDGDDDADENDDDDDNEDEENVLYQLNNSI